MVAEERVAQGSTKEFCSAWPNQPDHNMIAYFGEGKYVRAVEICSSCGWIDFAALDGYAENAIKESLTRRAQQIAVAVDTEPFAFVERFDEVLSLEDIVTQALAAASLLDAADPKIHSRGRSIRVALMNEIRREMDVQYHNGIQNAASQMANALMELRKISISSSGTKTTSPNIDADQRPAKE
jgi:hypothetical protein